ncbi:unnamed protein product [Triticum turgidum subsp. durum]|uniref:RING-type E3 ubiquitin transferase n=1 Tax=Triticum turgidum subsp. durum TaxID=4567 RepID=A0A9R0VEY8_TRITD|nr:unnamed protein product [Triticum turgidum subsp. durum]
MAEEPSVKRTKTEDLGAGSEPDAAAAAAAAAAEEGERPSGEVTVKIQSKALCCRICSEPLKPPIFKCAAGHVLCSQCPEKLREVGHVLRLGTFCALCCKSTSYSRCVELEQFIDAMKVPCSNQTYGCNEFVGYQQKEKHESSCPHAPCYCPEDNCAFKAPACCLLDHFVTAHGWSPTNLGYNKPLKIPLARDRRFTLLVGEDMSLFLLINTLTSIGSALAVVCVRPHESEPSYSCNISAAGGKTDGRLVFQKDPHVSSSSLAGGVQMGNFFLLVPLEFAESSSAYVTQLSQWKTLTIARSLAPFSEGSSCLAECEHRGAHRGPPICRSLRQRVGVSHRAGPPICRSMRQRVGVSHRAAQLGLPICSDTGRRRVSEVKNAEKRGHGQSFFGRRKYNFEAIDRGS